MAKLVRAKSPVRWFRRILLAFGLLTLGALGVMLAAYRFGSSDRPDRPAQERTAGEVDTDESTVTSGQGFDYIQWSQGRKVFRIRAERSQQDRDETAYLESVTLDIFRAEEDAVYTVTSRSAKVNQKNWAALLEGDVVIRGWSDLVLEARAIELLQGGQVLQSRGAVEFSYPPDIVGRASHLKLDRKQDIISLSDGVHVKTVPQAEVPMRLDCERLVYRRGEGMIRATDNVMVRRGPQELRGRILTLFLTPEREFQSLRARFDVRGLMHTLSEMGEPGQIGMAGQLLEVTPHPQHADSQHIRLEGGPEGGPSIIRMVDASGLARRMTGRLLEATSTDGGLELVEGHGDPMVIDEYLDFPEPFPLRQACARKVTARFLASGELGHMQLEQSVEMRDEAVHLSGGEQASFDLEKGQIEIKGDGVQLYNDRGDVASPHISYSQETGYIHARDGVRARLVPGSALRDTPFSNGEGPLHVESQEAFWAGDPPAFAFRGSVRAWRQQNLLLTEQLRGDEEGKQMSAAGGVKTLWIPTSASSSDGALGDAAGQPIEVDAEQLSYRQDENLLLYSGKVTVQQQERTIQCEELAVELSPGGSDAERMTCTGDMKLEDPPAQRQVFGDVAVYTVASEQIEVRGDKVRLIDADSNTLEGRYLLYDLNAGTVHLQSRVPESQAPEVN